MHVTGFLPFSEMGCDELSAQVGGCSEAIFLSLSSAEMEQENNLSSEISKKARRIKDIEDCLRARPAVGWCSVSFYCSFHIARATHFVLLVCLLKSSFHYINFYMICISLYQLS